MPSQIEAIEIKRKMFFEHEGAPYHCLDVDVSKPTARGGQTLVRLKMRNLLTRAVFDKTFKAGDKFKEPDLARVEAIYQYADGDGFLGGRGAATMAASTANADRRFMGFSSGVVGMSGVETPNIPPRQL